jgi:hypothetical protein
MQEKEREREREREREGEREGVREIREASIHWLQRGGSS